MNLNQLDKFRGCLIGGAVGDALGGAVEFKTRQDIISALGEPGITDYAYAYGGLGKITDDTQMTLFTAEGLLAGQIHTIQSGNDNLTLAIGRAYQRWLLTQKISSAITMDAHDNENPSWLMQQQDLHHRRAPGNTCLSALIAMQSFDMPANNDSKGCGGVMRAAPVGLFAYNHAGMNNKDTFELGNNCAALTHGHPTGILTAGFLALLIKLLLDGQSLEAAIQKSCDYLIAFDEHEETLTAAEAAIGLAQETHTIIEAIEMLGEGWIAEEALAIALYCCLKATTFEEAIIMAVNHDGDSDSTGAITGNIMGAIHGLAVIPKRWLDSLELRDVIDMMSTDLFEYPSWPENILHLQSPLALKYPL
ncbi:ADP-ribosylglycohydrolase family protein [Methylophaga pinxianii]|uniref:ADP-ribosylglycohydrolase family protein n=1 Tax=Methylophaga pinxianii TaxID=2881052 RepID=UPI001CF1D49E|nr:ADP-ribosylglycohydrolase family protein [Methylophaga pinxianii]MCB2426426.1 ADP-ribosylglycohydrolase family protein [Methylophaga pinxianii]UPH44997.1 ADP-ribosylglycohydrolase family protein [Methylophaga pinxianii]